MDVVSVFALPEAATRPMWMFAAIVIVGLLILVQIAPSNDVYP